MSQDEFTKLFKYMQKIEKKLDNVSDGMSTKQDIHSVLSRFDSIEKQLEISEDERLVVGYQLDRLNRWVHDLADKIGYKLTI